MKQEPMKAKCWGFFFDGFESYKQLRFDTLENAQAYYKENKKSLIRLCQHDFRICMLPKE